MRPPIIVDEATFTARVAALIATGGDNVAANIPLEEVADLIYTRRMKISPGTDAPPVVKVPKEKKPKVQGAAKLDDWVG